MFFRIQVVLRASAGMDYWEFAQFLITIGLPRLREAQSLLSSMGEPPDCVILSSIEQLLLKLTTSSKKLTFFKNGTLPQALQLTSAVHDSLATCEWLICPAYKIKEETNPRRPFASLYHLLPQRFQQVLVSNDDRETRQTIGHAQLTFRLFELMNIKTVLSEVLQNVSIQ